MLRSCVAVILFFPGYTSIVFCATAETNQPADGPWTQEPRGCVFASSEYYYGHKTGAYDSECSFKLASCCLNPYWPHGLKHSVIHKIVEKTKTSEKGSTHSSCNIKDTYSTAIQVNVWEYLKSKSLVFTQNTLRS